MTTDSHLIRAERHTEIGFLIQRDAGLLIDRWCKRAVEEQANAKRVHHEALRDRLLGLLWALGRSLAESDDAETSLHRLPAREHGEQRWESGWSLPEVVRDYQILRLVILDYLEEALERPFGPREVMAVGLALDEAIAASVSAFVRHREEYLLDVERAHAEEERRARQALKEIDRRKDEFLAMLAHELRNPLASIVNSLEMLRLSGLTDPKVVQVREVVDRQVKQIVRLVDDLLDMTRISQGKVELRKQRFGLAAAVGEAVQTVRPLIEARQHQLDVRVPAEALELEADQARVVQVLVNLLANAAKYTDPGGRIELTAERSGDLVVIRVRDSGVGIPPEMLTRIFALYAQLDPARDRSRGGLGIGLTLVHRLVEMLGGEIRAHSAGPGQGSEFTVSLPAAPQQGAAAPAAAGREGKASAARHVLIIEDNPDGRETLRVLLALMGHRVEVAASGAEGVALARAGHPQAALIDIGLPEMDGYQVAQRLRAELGRQIFLIALTGFGQAGDRQRAEESGFDAHLTKPVEVSELSRLLALAPQQKY